MKSKKLIALLTALAMLLAAAPTFARSEDIPPPIEPEALEIDEIDEPILPDELDVLNDEAAVLDVAVMAETGETADTRLRGEINSYDTLQGAIDEASDGETIQLADSIDIGTNYISITKPLTLDLNGCTLQSANSSTAIYVNGGDLTIVDDSGAGKVVSTAKCAVWVKAGSLTVESVTLETQAKYYAVNCAAGTETTINGGAVTGQYAISTSGTLEINGGEITGTNGIAVVANAGSELTMSGGSITGSTGIYTSGTVTMDGGTVTGTSYGINALTNSVITINAGKVQGTAGYGIYSKAGAFTLTMSGGEVIGQNSGIYTAESSAGTGAAANITISGGNVTANTYYGIRLMKEANLTIDGGTISCSSTSSSSFYGILSKENSTITMKSGTVEAISTDYNKYYPFGIYAQGDITIYDGVVTATVAGKTDVDNGGCAISGNGSVDKDGIPLYGNTNYIIEGGTITGGGMGIYHPQDGYMEINGGTITGGLTGIEMRAGNVTVNDGTIIGLGKPVETNPNGSGATTEGAGIAVVQHTTYRDTVLTVNNGNIQGFIPIFEKNIQGNPPEEIAKVKIYLKGGVYENTNITDPDRIAVFTEDVEHYMTGGIYSSKIPYEYIDPEYYRRHLHENMYEGEYEDYFEVTKPNFTVVEKASIPDAEIELVDLRGNEGIDQEPFSTYRVVLSKAADEDVQAMTEEKENQGDVNTKMSAFIISVEKTDDAGKTTNITEGILQQAIKVTLLNAETPLENVNVYYIDQNDHLAKVEGEITVVDNTVTFTAPELSTYAITYNPIEPTAEDIADEIGVVFEQIAEGSNQYYIKLKPLAEGKVLNRYMSSDIAFNIECTDGRVIYEIEPALYKSATLLKETGDSHANSREYHFEMDGINEPDETCIYRNVNGDIQNEGIILGTVTFKGYGEFNFTVDVDFNADPAHTVNIANTAEAVDNIVEHYAVEEIPGYGKLVVNEVVDGYKGTEALKDNESGTIHDILSPDTAALTVNIAFNNTVVTENPYEYQNMTLTISGGHLDEAIVIKLGNDSVVPEGTTVTLGEEDSSYKVVVEDTLLRNVLYSIKLEGAGYRTAYHTLLMTNDKTLNFWNNVKDEKNAMAIEAGKTKVTKNFLAGDIVDDKNINIYDLSAVVSYFGSDANTQNGYAKYDLNRDGVIDSKDVAYVLVSWGN